MNDTENQTPEQVAQMRDENRKFETTTEPSTSGQRAVRIPARDLVGHEILIISTVTVDGKFAAAFRKTNGGELFWFYPGLVVTEQLQNTRLPVWAKMTMRDGRKHSYYMLTLAETTGVERIAPTLEETLCQLKSL
jgi:hypothetical protein